MPVKESAKKALRQSQRRKVRNLRRKRKIKDLIKEVRNLLSQNKTKEVKELLPQVYKALDKAVKTGVIKKNTAARKKSRVTKLLTRVTE